MPNKVNLNALQKFLIWSAGADHEVLAKEGYLIERYKYESIGNAIILTSIIAFFSGGYAIFTVFNSIPILLTIPISLTIGTIWSVVIFNLNRFFILTINQRKPTSKRQLFVTSTLRLSIAILLSLVIAKPLELGIFKEEIDQQLQLKQVKKQIVDTGKKQAKRIKNIKEERKLALNQQMNNANSSLLARLRALENLSKRDSTIAIINGAVTFLFILLEISPILIKSQGVYEEILEKENKYKTNREKLHRIKEKEILKLEQLKDFELKIEVLIIDYLRVKERNKERLENIGIDDIERINKQYEQDNTKFIQICRDKLEHYKYLADEVLGSDID